MEKYKDAIRANERESEMRYVDLRETIKSLIAESGMKQKVVAERAGFTEQMMTDMLNGRKVIKAEFVPAICLALGVTPNRLFQWDGRGA